MKKAMFHKRLLPAAAAVLLIACVSAIIDKYFDLWKSE
ncbi:hypothetical protein GPUN_2750 [Glaciecola punicea ACAM 611]|uniref:Lipoprotein n=1 Tax=Glaciecola punicea ACAM 611 TaxID=1121923 RepID=H5TET7_9ALTE|nr:hypothetical protein GPUN_2750 [Glaciecola punicea ACAM 611]